VADVSLQDLLDAPERAACLTRSEAARLLAAVMLRLSLPDAPTANGQGAPLLTAAEAGARLGLTAREVYRRADRWPFTRRLGPKTLRFDAAGLEKYLGRNGRP
jgi:hypothetical protein